MYSKVVVSCDCHIFLKPVRNLVLYCTISLYICTRYVDVAMPYLDVTNRFRSFVLHVQYLYWQQQELIDA